MRPGSGGRAGLTLPEILVVAGILVTVLVAWAWYWSASAAVDQDTTAEQEYFNQLALLESRLKRDLRSAVGLRETAPGIWVIRVLAGSPSGRPAVTEITWQASGDGRRVERRDAGGRADVYDFAGFLGTRRFIFRITP